MGISKINKYTQLTFCKMATYIDLVNGLQKLKATIQAFTGNPDEVISTDGSGLISDDLISESIKNKVTNVTSGEALTAGQLVYLDETDSGNAYIAGYDASLLAGANAAEGFVLTSVGAAASVDVYLTGTVTGLVGLVPGETYYLDTAGAITATAPTLDTVGDISQPVGVALSATELCFKPERYVCLA